MTPFRLSLATLALAAVLPSQCPPERLTLGPIDCDALTGVPLNLGCQFLNGEIFVSGTEDSIDGPYSVFVFDTAGTLLRSFPQPAAITSGFGLRDGATDGTNLFFGNEDGIFGFDPNGNPVNSVQAANGRRRVNFPIRGDGLNKLGNYRALAFDPNGDGGRGSFFSGTFGSDIIEIDRRGRILNEFTSNGQWSVYGLALIGDELWINDDGPGFLVALDKRVGILNGRSLRAEVAVPGGLSVGPDDTLVWLNQGTPDEVFATTLPTFATRSYELLTGSDGTLDRSISPINAATTTFRYDLDAPPGTLYQAYLTAFPESTLCADSRTALGLFFLDLLPGLKNFYSASVFSWPSTPRYAESPALAGTPVVLNAPLLVGNVPDGIVRVQALYLDFSGPPQIVPVRSTTEGLWDLDSTPIVGVRVSADGANSFNSDATVGFWRIENTATDPGKAITEVTLDFSVNFATQEFDTDQTNMADLFEGGNSAAPGCAGTFRNGSDTTAGLVFDGSNTTPSSPCDPTAQTGWIGSNPGDANDDWRTLTFRFAGGTFLNGTVFEFDCDTDNQGTNGAAMAGLVVTIRFADGSTASGVLAATGPSRSEVLL